MVSQVATASIPMARPLAAGRSPRRLNLELSDGYQTSVYHHAAAGAARTAVVYFHGIQSHPGWFCGSADYLAQAGCPVFQITRRGSGDNAVARGDAPSARQLLDDVSSACDFARRESGAGSVAMVGVSWGGKLLAAWTATRKPADVASLTLVAPGIVPRVDVSMATKLHIAACLLCRPCRLFDIPLNDVELFTDNPAMRQYLRNDPCRLMKASSRFLFASKWLDLAITRSRPGAITAPTTLILSANDRIIDSVATTQAVASLTANHATVQTLPGQHTLEFETDPQPFYKTLLAAIRS